MCEKLLGGKSAIAEYQYLKESLKDLEADSLMQAAIDNMGENIKIVLCGSYISIMKELLQEQNPLFERFTKILYVETITPVFSTLSAHHIVFA